MVKERNTYMKIQKIVKLMTGTVVACALVACGGPGPIEKETTYEGNEGDSLESGGEPVIETEEAPPAIDFADMNNREVDAEGNSVTDLDLLNEALESARQKNAAPGEIRGKTMEEQMNSSAPKDAPKIETLEDLVKAGLIKAVPAAPAGKKYVIKDGQVILE